MLKSKELDDAIEIFTYVINQSDIPQQLKKQATVLLQQTFEMVYSLGKADAVKELTAKFDQGGRNGIIN